MKVWVPFTIAFLLVQVLANWAAGTLGGTLPHPALMDWGISGIGLDRGEIHRLITATFLSHNISMFFRQLVFVAVVVGLYEHWFGTLCTFATFFAIDIIGLVFVLILIAGPMNDLPEFATMDTNTLHDVGMSAGGFGLLGALTASLQWRWLWLIVGIGVLGVKSAFDLVLIADTAHLLTFALGFAQHVLLRVRRSQSGVRTKMVRKRASQSDR